MAQGSFSCSTIVPQVPQALSQQTLWDLWYHKLCRDKPCRTAASHWLTNVIWCNKHCGTSGPTRLVATNIVGPVVPQGLLHNIAFVNQWEAAISRSHKLCLTGPLLTNLRPGGWCRNHWVWHLRNKLKGVPNENEFYFKIIIKIHQILFMVLILSKFTTSQQPQSRGF